MEKHDNFELSGLIIFVFVFLLLGTLGGQHVAKLLQAQLSASVIETDSEMIKYNNSSIYSLADLDNETLSIYRDADTKKLLGVGGCGCPSCCSIGS